jgi:TolB protein
LFSKSYRGKQDEVRALAHRAADEIVEALTGRPGIASSRIVMVGTQSGSKELYYCDADGHNLVQWTRDKSVSVAPKWGPEGRKVVYTSYLRRFPDVFSIDLSSGKREQIAGYGGLNTGADISPDGRDVVLILSKDGNPELYVKNLKSGRLTRLTKTPHAVEASPSWSPDGEQIVYVSDQSGRPQLYMLSRKGGRPVRLTTRGLENVSPDWGSSGLIVFSSRVGGRYQVCTVDPRTREVTQITEGRADFEDPSWAPDGRHIAATRTENYRSEVYILDTMGDPPIALTRYKGDWYSPAWSPR